MQASTVTPRVECWRGWIVRFRRERASSSFNLAETTEESWRPTTPPAIQSRLGAMGIKVVMLPNGMLHGLPHQPDGQHLTPEGYHVLAEELVGQVAAALGR
jgi:lysophospholipase L1-like esterase